MAVTKNATTVVTDEPREILSLAEASARYDGEWVLLKVTAWDERHYISQGEVLEHSTNRKQITRTVRRVHKQDPTAHLCVFPGGMETGSGEELYEALKRGIARAAQEDYVNVNW
jgi:hypothetical protein